MPIKASSKEVVTTAPVETKVFDSWWVTSLSQSTTVDPHGTPTVTLNVSLRKFRYIDKEETKIEFAPGAETTFRIPDLYAEAEKNQTVAATISAMLGGIVAIGTAKEIL
jgi:hypothetical protein